jgi:predicted amidohydrolase YtcJ
MTIAGHHAARDVSGRGELRAQAPADLTWLDRDPVTTDPDELTKTEVLGTWIAGRRVWPQADAESA